MKLNIEELTNIHHTYRYFSMPQISMMADDNNENTGSDEETGIAVAEHTKPKLPKKYKVLIHNDDYTTMEFVILVLQKFFSKSIEEAKHVMLKVHNEGAGVCGVYTFEVAESKANKVVKFAREHGHPLKCSTEEE